MGKALMIPNVNWASKNFGRVTRMDELSISGESTITASGTYTAYYNGNAVSVTWSLTGNGTISTVTGTSTTVVPSANGTLLLTATYGNKTASLSITAEPYNYQVLDHITSSYAQYITTDYYPNQDTVVEAKFKFTNTATKQQRIFSNRFTGQSGNDGLLELYLNSNTAVTVIQNSASGIVLQTTNTTYEWTVKTDSPNTLATYTYNASHQNLTKNLTAIADTSASALVIFGSQTDDHQMASINLYYLKIWDGETLVHDYEPRSLNGVCGLLDTVTGIFYDSDTETPFTGE